MDRAQAQAQAAQAEAAAARAAVVLGLLSSMPRIPQALPVRGRGLQVVVMIPHLPSLLLAAEVALRSRHPRLRRLLGGCWEAGWVRWVSGAVGAKCV